MTSIVLAAATLPVQVMPWWSWLIIWTALVLALLAMLGLSAWWLFRKFLVLTENLGDLAGTLEVLDVEAAEPVRAQLAILADLRDIRAREDARRFRRATRRRERHERRMARARRITRLDASQQQWPAAWTERRAGIMGRKVR